MGFAPSGCSSRAYNIPWHRVEAQNVCRKYHQFSCFERELKTTWEVSAKGQKEPRGGGRLFLPGFVSSFGELDLTCPLETGPMLPQGQWPGRPLQAARDIPFPLRGDPPVTLCRSSLDL